MRDPRELNALWQQGRRTEARAGLEALMRARPTDPQPHALLAFWSLTSGDLAGAIACQTRACTLAPREAALLFNLGNMLRDAGQLQPAAGAFARAAAARQGYVEALVNLGATRLLLGEPGPATAVLREALRYRPGDLPCLLQLGTAQLAEDDASGALTTFDAAVRRAPQSAPAHIGRANALAQRHERQAALASYSRALDLDPTSIDAAYNRGNTYYALSELELACADYRAVLTREPRHLGALTNLGATLRRLGRMDEAQQVLGVAADVDPASARVAFNLGNVAFDCAMLGVARAHYERAIALDPLYADAHFQLGCALRRADDNEAALAAHERAVELSPASITNLGGLLLTHLELADFAAGARAWESLRAQWRSGISLPSDVLLVMSDDPILQRQCGEATAALIQPADGDRPRPRRTPPARLDRACPLRVAYLSPDFGDHPVGSSIVQLLESHDRRRVTPIGLALSSPGPGRVRTRIEGACAEFHDVTELDTPAIVALLRRLDLAILVDLAGYTSGHRAPVLAARCAPVQVGYLGFAYTLGAPWLDYLLADPRVIPATLAGAYSERIAWLPECFFPSDAEDTPGAASASRDIEGLPAGRIVFACFNASSRINEPVAAAFMRILAQVPDSVLWLQGKSDIVRRHWCAFARAHGVDAQRLVFLRYAPSRAEHLARHKLADLYLDTFPYNSHSTARDALRAGLPVLTCSGQSFASRVAMSLLHTLGFSELCTTSLADYEAQAVSIARTPGALATLRASLATKLRETSLFDMRRLAAHVEDAYETMVERASRGEPPVSFHVAPRP